MQRSSYRLQKRVLILLVAAIVLLALLLIGVKHIVRIFPYVDPADGAKYYAKPKDGVYSIYDAAGEALLQNESGYYLTASGTQLELNPSTGKITEYAVVDVEGEEVVGINSRILMFPQIRQADVARIQVTNQYGSYTFYTDKNGNVQIQGFETDRVLIAYDEEKYAALCVGAGYPLTTRKLNTAEVLKRGYAEYGLVPEIRTDEEGKEYEYTPTRYTITSKSGISYTVLVGDSIISEAGYYVKLDGEQHPAVYIMGNSAYDAALLQPIEQLITPMIAYPSSNYYNVQDFVLATYEDGQTSSPEINVAFDYIDLLERENTLYSINSYLPATAHAYKYKDYRLDSDAAAQVLASLSDPAFVNVCKLGLSPTVLTEYGLDQPRHILVYDLRVDTNGDGVMDAVVENSLLISKKTTNGTYYVASARCDVIVEIDESSLYFLNYEAIDWVAPQVIWTNLAFLRSIDIKSPSYNATITMDNSASDQSNGISSANIKFQINGITPDYIVYKTSYASGVVTEETPVYNLRQFYKSLLFLTIAGNASDGHFSLTEEQMATYRAMNDSECQLVLTIDAEDMASVYNAKYYSQNNKQSLTLRFYRYSEGRSYMTINGEGEFFVDASFVEKIIADAQRLESGVLVDASSKT